MKKFSLFILIWLLSVIASGIYVYENPERVEIIKQHLKKNKNLVEIKEYKKENIYRIPGNSFVIELSEQISFTERTAFIIYDGDVFKIYFQNGYLFKNPAFEKLNLPNTFTTARNGGIKTIFFYNDKEFALISSLKDKCFYASIVLLENGNEIFKTKCLPGSKKNIDYNGLGSSYIHLNDKILLSIGTPEQTSTKISELAQDENSMFGKIIEVNKNDLGKIIANQESNLNVKIFSKGHRNPQGLTKINDFFFSVEHGPRGGDELNKIIKDKNYGWPKVSYGTRYGYDENAKAYEINHESNFFEEPIFAFVPSVAISALSTCPVKLKKYYKKPCLLALSLYGNSQRPGKSLIIFLLNEKMNKVHSIEKIFLRNDLKLRHFVTNSRNELYEDENGSIYISADKKGIYKLNFVEFRN